MWKDTHIVPAATALCPFCMDAWMRIAAYSRFEQRILPLHGIGGACIGSKTGLFPSPLPTTTASAYYRLEELWATPAAIFQPLSGLWLMHMAGLAWDTPWIIISIALYLIAGLCWLPVVWIQIQMRKIATESAEQGQNALPPAYWRYARIWESLGYPAFLAMLAVYFLMAVKPAFS